MLKIVTLVILLGMHPVHVSLTSIEHIQDTDSVKVFVRMFYDDFLLDYKLFDKNVNSDDYLSGSRLFPAELMNKYLAEKIIISINNKQLKCRLINLDLAVQDNEISANLFYRSNKKPEIISVRNEIMTGLYNDQANMTIIKVRDFEEGVKFTPENTERTFVLK